MKYITSLIVPVLILYIVLLSINKKKSTFDDFITGAKDGLNTCVKIAPIIIGFVTSIHMLKASGFFTIIEGITAPLFYKLGFPPQLLTIALLKPISGSGSLAVLNDILSTYGPDSFNGRCASIIMCSTETTFYTIAIYFGSVNLKVPMKTIKSAIIADLTAVISAITAVKLFF